MTVHTMYPEFHPPCVTAGNWETGKALAIRALKMARDVKEDELPFTKNSIRASLGDLYLKIYQLRKDNPVAFTAFVAVFNIGAMDLERYYLQGKGEHPDVHFLDC